MPTNIRLITDDVLVLTRVIRNMSPVENPVFTRRALLAGGLLVQENAALVQIKEGGKDAPIPNRLTSRSGTGRRSIRVDRNGLRHFFVDVGTDIGYMRVHETGGLVNIPTHNVAEHTRRTRHGRQTVRSHSRAAHTARFPPRPFLVPAVEAVANELEGLFALEWEASIGDDIQSV